MHKRAEVRAGCRVQWEAENIGADTNADAPAVIASLELGLNKEDLVCDWNTTGGEEYSWPDLLASLQARRLPAHEGTLNDVQLVIASRNLSALAASNCLILVQHERTNRQL